MNEQNKELLSALIDGEVDLDNKMLDTMTHDQEMKDKWSRYHLIGDCLRGQLPEKISGYATSCVTDVLTNEPTVLAPQKSKQFNLKPLAGFAIAASVAMVAVFSVQRGNDVDPVSTSSSIASTSVNEIIAQPKTYSFPEVQMLPASVSDTDTPEAIANKRLNNYLMNHNEYRSNGSVNGMLPYVRLVTIESQE
jgi:sigma-E factor negative regulatory protein RseA